MDHQRNRRVRNRGVKREQLYSCVYGPNQQVRQVIKQNGVEYTFVKGRLYAKTHDMIEAYYRRKH